MIENEESKGPASAFESPTFGQDGSFDLDKPVGSASISPCGRDVVLASRQGLHIIDLDSPYSPPRHLPHHTPWEVADVQWSPFAARDYWVVSTSNQKALVWNLMASTASSVEHVLHAHTRAITDINFSAHNPDILATCAIDSFVHCWDLRHPSRPAMTFCDWFAAATQVKWNRQDSHILASSHDKFLRIWDDRKGAYPLRSIEAHSTKIYGVDWSRTEASSLATCSLDRTIKFWDYTDRADEPHRVLHTPFPVWRARHTPFGSGLLAMPQRGDHDLHLYDSKIDKDEDRDQVPSTVARFGGHHDQVKEFLWRPRGTITESNDDRDFQLVSWGTDRILRLHHVDDEVLGRVGYEKGMRIERRMNFTRRNAIYKTFREGPRSIPEDDREEVLGNRIPQNGPAGMRSALTTGMSRAPVPFIGGYGNGGFMRPITGRKSALAKDMDPISWMRGVKIGKRETSPSGLHQSVSSILSPSLKTDPTWDTFESLGEEITQIGGKFTKVSFDEVDIQRRKIIVSLTGPWGTDNRPTYVKAYIEFSPSYPDAVMPSVSLEKTADLGEDVANKLSSDVSEITANFLSRQRSSLEAILRYLLGEQSLEESLLWLKKRQQSLELDSALEVGLSSSDEDDEMLEKYAGSKVDDMESSNPMIAKSRTQNNPPLPKACGALWADDGRLVCFFPPRQDKESSLLGLNFKADERSSKTRKSIFEGFGRFNGTSYRKRQTGSTLETIESGGSDSEEYLSSSSGTSSASDDIGLPRHHFMPSMAWRGDASEALPYVSLNESQKSSNGMEKAKSTSSREKNFVSIHDYRDLLPAKECLARNYIIGNGSRGNRHNADTARETGDVILADVWLFVDLILQDNVPLEVMNHGQSFDRTRDTDTPAIDPILMIARRAPSKLTAKDSAIDLTFDGTQKEHPLTAPASIKWGHHPLSRRYLVDALFRYYEQVADVQTLAMLSCALSENWNTLKMDVSRSGSAKASASESAPFEHRKSRRNYYPSEGIAKAHLHKVSAAMSNGVEHLNIESGPTSTTSSTGAPVSDLSASTTPPSSYRPLRTTFEPRESLATSLSTSPEQIRRTHRSSPNLTAFGASLARPPTLSASVASSPPRNLPRKRSSPAGSYLGVSTSTSTWSPSQYFGRSSSIIVEDPKSSFTLSVSDTEDEAPQAVKEPLFRTSLKNQERFHNDGYADIALLDPQQEWRYRAYRELYAHLLYIWNLPIVRGELLKYNGAPTADTSLPGRMPASLATSKARLASTTFHSNVPRLDYRDHCSKCNIVLTEGSLNRHCQNCSSRQTPPICLLCNTFIYGLSSPCLHCGHVLHNSCREMLISQKPEDVPSECISGCGCICTDHAGFEIMSGEYVATRADLSPAASVTGDAVTNEQEQLGWYDNSEWEDMAYESLARNLRPRREVKPKSSQIWRGRNQST